MDSEFIKYHADSNTYIIEKKAFFEDDLSLDGNLIVGPGSNFWKSLRVSGSLELGKNSCIKNDVKAGNAIVGSRSQIGGNIEITNDLTLLDEAHIKGDARCGGQMLVRPGCSIGFAKADTRLELVGKVDVKNVEAGTKVIVRSE